MKRFFVMSLLYLLLFMVPMICTAQTMDFTAIKDDFEPAEAVLVMPLAGEWLLDVDAEQGVSPGDLFSVIEKGQAVLHPTTNEIIGHIEKARSVLRITKIKSGYSYATVVKVDGELKPGLPVRRFAGLTARMLDTTNEGRALYSELQAALPHLEWVSYVPADKASAPTTDLLFRYELSGLTVVGSDNTPLRFYAGQPSVAAVMQQMPGQAASPGVSSGGGIVVAKHSQMPSQGGAIVRNQIASQDGVWRSPQLKDVAVGMDVADLDGDGNQEIAFLTASSIGIARLVDGEYKQIVNYELPNALNALALDAADLDGNGQAELYLTAARGEEVDSAVFELEGSTLKVAAGGLPYYFRNTHLAGEGRVLLAQRYGTHAKPFVGSVSRVQRRGNKISLSTSLSLPSNTNVYSFVAMGNGMVARFKQQSLAVVSPTGELWKGLDYNSASEISIDFLDPNDRGQTDTIPYFIPPRVADGGNGLVLATVHKDSLMSHRFQSFRQGRVAAYQWDGASMQEVWHTQPQGGYLADFSYADADNDGVKEIVGFFTFGRGGVLDFSKGRSAVMVFELN